MAPKRKRGGKQRDETFQANPDDEEDEEEPLADDDEDEEERKKRQKKADLEGGLKLWHDVLADKRSSPKGRLADLKGPNTLGEWTPESRSLPKEIVKAFHEIGHPIKSCTASRNYVRALAKICFDKDVAFPVPGEGYTLREWIAMLLAWAATLKRGSRRNLQLREAALLAQALLVVSAEGAYKLATPKPGACELCSTTAIKQLFKHFPGADEIIWGDYFKVTRVGFGFDITVLKKKKLYRDHLELSILFRGWLCVHCNAHKLHKLDSLSSDDYKVFGRRVYVNCTTFI